MEYPATSLPPGDPHSLLIERARQMLAGCSAAEFRALLTEQDRDYLHQAFSTMLASEGSIWIADQGGQNLVMCINTGPEAAHLELKVHQTLTEGVVSKVFKDDAPYTDQGWFRDVNQSSTVDEELRQVTHHISAYPLHVLGCKLGVLSAVQLVGQHAEQPRSWGFPKSLSEIWCLLHSGLASLVENRIIRRLVNQASDSGRGA